MNDCLLLQHGCVLSYALKFFVLSFSFEQENVLPETCQSSSFPEVEMLNFWHFALFRVDEQGLINHVNGPSDTNVSFAGDCDEESVVHKYFEKGVFMNARIFKLNLPK